MKADPICVEKGLNFEWYSSFGVKHNAIIEKFGRYPHRNAVLGRESTPEEEEYLKTLKIEDRYGQ